MSSDLRLPVDSFGLLGGEHFLMPSLSAIRRLST